MGMRWRTQKEVVGGKGQFVCGAKGCDNREGLCSYEVDFEYRWGGWARAWGDWGGLGPAVPAGWLADLLAGRQPRSCARGRLWRARLRAGASLPHP